MRRAIDVLDSGSIRRLGRQAGRRRAPTRETQQDRGGGTTTLWPPVPRLIHSREASFTGSFSFDA
jgi:hypothetical protein